MMREREREIEREIERETERETERDRERNRERDRESGERVTKGIYLAPLEGFDSPGILIFRFPRTNIFSSRDSFYIITLKNQSFKFETGKMYEIFFKCFIFY